MMNRSELIRLSIGQIGISLGYLVITMNLESFFIETAFASSPWKNTLAFTVLTIAFGAGALTYLISGYLSDKTFTRWGRRRPYILVAIPGGITLILLGLNYFPLSIIGIFVLLTSLCIIYTITYRLMYTNYWALFMDLTKPKDRVKSTITFNLFGLVGIGIALALPIPTDVGDPTTYSYIVTTTLCGIAYIASILFVFFFGPKENLELIKKQQKQRLYPSSILSSISGTFKNKNFRNYAVSAFFASLCYCITMFIFKPFIEWKTGEERAIPIPIDFMYVLLFILPIALLIFYFCNWASKKWGKQLIFKRVLMFGFFSFPLTIFLAAQGGPISLIIQLLIFITIIISVVIVIFSFQNAILMDISPKGKEATYTGVFFFIIVLPIPIASTIAGPLLDIFNYDIFIWLGQDFAYVIIVLIMAFALFLSYIFLRKVR